MTAVTETDRGYESKHRALWALGDYTAVATEVVAPLGPILVQATEIN
ncbi:MAG TPA: SAM-dependent methyltransferase, partial [Mycobacterium sp.]|nr:SAM-dependent methyltransferase [Mycobacterium sp.]